MRHTGSCHCGQVRFEVVGEFTEAITCNCSICFRKGHVLAFIPESDLTLLQGESSLSDYQFGNKKIHHRFCKTCGIGVFGQAKAPDGSNGCAINLRCIEDIDLSKVNITEFDGRSL